jgi:hypothetical protein
MIHILFINCPNEKILKLIHKFPSLMYTNMCVYVNYFKRKKSEFVLLNNISITILWKKKNQTHDL